MSNDGICLACYFLDVGQGTSQVLLFGNGRGIVIDGGPDAEARIPLMLLRRYVDTLDALIVSHNDADHETGAREILTNYQSSIRALYFLEDRPFEDIRILTRANEINKARRKAKLREVPVIRLEADGDRPRTISKDSEKRIHLDLVYPNLKANLKGRKRPKVTSGVLRLTCGTRRVVFSGDAPVAAWRWMIRDGVIEPPVRCDFMTVPHHGGNVGSEVQLRWLFTKTVICDHSMISVGTRNAHGHPTKSVIKILSDEARAKVLCTQATSRCCDAVEQLRPGRDLILPDLYSQSHPSMNRDGQHLPCAGTVVAEIGSDSVKIDVWVRHQAGVDRLRAMDIGHPLCRT